MDEEFKTFLAKKEITVDEYKGGSLEAKAKLVETFEKSKPRETMTDYVTKKEHDEQKVKLEEHKVKLDEQKVKLDEQIVKFEDLKSDFLTWQT
eukprot:gene12471-14272_t